MTPCALSFVIDVDHPRKCLRKGSSVGRGNLKWLGVTLCTAQIALKIKRKWLYASGGKDGVIPRKRAKVDLFSTPGMSCKSESKPESEDPLGMEESPERLELVARAEVKVMKKGTDKVSVRAPVPLFLNLGNLGEANQTSKDWSLPL